MLEMRNDNLKPILLLFDESNTFRQFYNFSKIFEAVSLSFNAYVISKISAERHAFVILTISSFNYYG